MAARSHQHSGISWEIPVSALEWRHGRFTVEAVEHPDFNRDWEN